MSVNPSYHFRKISNSAFKWYIYNQWLLCQSWWSTTRALTPHDYSMHDLCLRWWVTILIHQIIFFGFTFLNILYFFKYSCTNIFHRRSLYTFYQVMHEKMSTKTIATKHPSYVINSEFSVCSELSQGRITVLKSQSKSPKIIQKFRKIRKTRFLKLR